MARTSHESVTFDSALHPCIEEIDKLLSAFKATEERLSTEVDETEKALLKQECERISGEVKRILLQAHRRAHPLDIAGMVQVAVARGGVVVASPPVQSSLPKHPSPPKPLPEDAPATPTREAILADIQALTPKLQRGAKERGRAQAEIKEVLATWFDAHYGAEDPRLVRACIPFVDHLPEAKRFRAFRKRVREAIGFDPTTEEKQTEEASVIPDNWPWRPYFTGKRIAVVGGLETDLRHVLARNLAPATITWFETEGSEDTRVRASLFRQMRGAFDLIMVTRFAPRLFGLEVLATARQLQVPAFRVKSGSNLAQILRAAEEDLPRPKAN